MSNCLAEMRVPYGQTVHGDEEIAAVVEVLRTSTQMGKNVRAFQAQIAQLYHKKHGIMVNSGSSANYLAVELLNLPENSEVITPVLTFSTTVAPLIKNKLIPVFVDVEKDTYNINVTQIESKITKNTRALMIPNLIGNLPDWQIIRDIADRYNLTIIEDSADTLGATIDNKSAGRFSDISTTSFYGSHVINCAGNGGMLCLNNDELAERATLLRSWGRNSSIFVESEKLENRFNVDLQGVPYDAKFVFSEIGYNYEPSEMGAAFGLVQLKKLEHNILNREKNFKSHYDFFARFADWFVLPKQLPNSRTGWLAFPLTIKDCAPFTRTQLQIYLEKHNIQTRTVFTGNILRQPGFANISCTPSKANDFPFADQVTRGGMLIGCHHGLTNEQINYIHDIFKQFSKSYLS